MVWRFLVDEDTDTGSADELVGRGHEAVTVASALGKGQPDRHIAEFARQEGRVLITSDRHFLDPSLHHGNRVLMVADDTVKAHEIAERVVELATLADDPDDLKPVTWI